MVSAQSRHKLACHSHLLGVDHGNLADESANVDEQVEVHVDARGRHDRVHNDTLARLRVPDEELLPFVLLSDERRDVRLETTGADTHDNDGDDKAC